MNILKGRIFAIILLPTSFTAAATSSIDLRVIGTVTPTACTPMLSGGGVVDYGSIHPTTLHATDYTVLPEMRSDLSITCDAPAKIGLKTYNNRLGSMAGSINEGTSYSRGSYVPVPILGQAASMVGGVGLGLGLGGEKIGGVAFKLDEATLSIDSANGNVIGNTYTGTTWKHGEFYSHLFDPQYSRMLSFSKPGSLTPEAFETMNVSIITQAYINKRSELNLTQPINLDGSITLEMNYL